MEQHELPGLGEGAAGGRGLVLRGPSDRFSTLLGQHRKLLRQVALKRQKLADWRQEMRRYAAELAVHAEPLFERLRELDREIHALFAELLAPKRLPKQSRHRVQEVYEQLQIEGVLSPAGAWGAGPAFEDPPRPGAVPPPGAAPPVDREQPSGAPGAKKNEGLLRGMFLRLAQALHPDRAQEATDAEARTEAMKEVNRAYQSRDLARLVEIEQRWDLSGTFASAPDDLDRRSEELASTNQALRAQLRALERELRELKRSEVGQLVGEIKGYGKGGVERFVEEGKEQARGLAEMRDFVQAFRDGRISLATFLAGPAGDEEEEIDFEVALAAISDWLDDLAAPPPPQRRKRKVAPKRKSRGK